MLEERRKRKMIQSVMMFVLGFTCVTSVYEIAKTSKSSKSDKIRKSAEKFADRK